METGNDTFSALESYFHAEIAYHEENYPEAMKLIYATAGPLPEVPYNVTREDVESTLDVVREVCAKIGQ